MKNLLFPFLLGMLTWAIFGGLVWHLIGALVIVLFITFIGSSGYLILRSLNVDTTEKEFDVSG